MSRIENRKTITADPEAGRLPEPRAGQLVDHFICERAAARHHADRSGLGDVAGQDPDLGEPRREQAGTVGADEARLAVAVHLAPPRHRVIHRHGVAHRQAFRDAHKLHSPYFSFTCDPHYSALGHEVAAEAIVRRLQEHQLLPQQHGSVRYLTRGYPVTSAGREH